MLLEHAVEVRDVAADTIDNFNMTTPRAFQKAAAMPTNGST